MPLAHYPAGTWGPHEAELLRRRNDLPPVARPERDRRRTVDVSSTTSPPRSPTSVIESVRRARSSPGSPSSCPGGPTARLCYEHLGRHGRGRPSTGRVVDVYIGDERCVPADDPDANQRLVRESLLDRVGPVRLLPPHVVRRGRPTAYDRLRGVRSPLSISSTSASGPTGTPPRSSPAPPALDAAPGAAGRRSTAIPTDAIPTTG